MGNIIALFNEQKYIPNERDLEIKEEREAKNRKYNIVLVPDRVRQILKELMSFCNTQNGNVDISNPEVKNLWKEAMYNNFSEKFNQNISDWNLNDIVYFKYAFYKVESFLNKYNNGEILPNNSNELKKMV